MKMMTGLFGYVTHMQSRSYDNLSVYKCVCVSVTMSSVSMYNKTK